MAATPSTVRAESIHFLESEMTAAGTLTGEVEIPVGAILLDVIVYAKAVWGAGTSADIAVGDTTDPNGAFESFSLKATDLTAGQSVNLDSRRGGVAGAFATEGTSTHVLHAMRDAGTAAPYGRVMQAVVTTVGTLAATGDTTVCFVYAYPSPMKPLFAAT